MPGSTATRRAAGLKAFTGSARSTALAVSAAPRSPPPERLVDYVGQTQHGKAPHLEPPRRVAPGSVMQIDAATRRNLELVTAASGERRGSLLATLDRTATAAGARLLADRLAAPLTDAGGDRRPPRCGRVFPRLLRDCAPAVRERLRHCPDIERALTRLSLGRGGPRDLAALRQSLGRNRGLRDMLGEPGLVPLPPLLGDGATRARRAWCAGRSSRAGARGGTAALRPRWRVYRCRIFRRTRRMAPVARRQPPHDRRPAGAIRRDDRDRRAEDPSQQRDRLLHRGVGKPRRQARAGIHPSPDDGWRSALYDRRSSPSSKPRSPVPPSARWHWNCGSTTISSARSWRAAPKSPRRRRRWRASMWPRHWPSARPRAAGCGRSSRPAPPSRSRAAATRWSRPLSPRPASGTALSPMIACWTRRGSGS